MVRHKECGCVIRATSVHQKEKEKEKQKEKTKKKKEIIINN